VADGTVPSLQALTASHPATTGPALFGLVGIAGAKGTGKSTVARELRESHGFGEVSFAAPLKDLARVLFGFSQEILHGDSATRDRAYLACNNPFSHSAYWGRVWATALRNLGNAFALFPGAPEAAVEERLFAVLDGLERLGAAFSPRVALQRLGTDFGRALDETVWVRTGLERARLNALHARPQTGRVVVSDVRFPDEARAIRAVGGHVWWIERPGFAPGPEAHASEPRAAAFDGLCTGALVNESDLASLRWHVGALVADAFGEPTPFPAHLVNRAAVQGSLSRQRNGTPEEGKLGVTQPTFTGEGREAI